VLNNYLAGKAFRMMIDGNDSKHGIIGVFDRKKPWLFYLSYD